MSQTVAGTLKININGFWTEGSTEGRVGIILRDSNDNVVAGRALHVDNIFSVAQVEVLATKEGAVLAIERGFTNVTFESDALYIISTL